MTNHIIDFILGVITFKYGLITGIFLLYQLIDGFKFSYNVTYKKNESDDLPMDLFFYSLGALSMRLFFNYYSSHRTPT